MKCFIHINGEYRNLLQLAEWRHRQYQVIENGIHTQKHELELEFSSGEIITLTKTDHRGDFTYNQVHELLIELTVI